jgi:branched-chain amino acid transport system permease protein
VLNHYSDVLPFLAQPGEAGVGAAEAARLLYGAAIVAVLLFAPGGLAQLVRRIFHSKELRHEPTSTGIGDSAVSGADRV